jgi:hypothetical protein
MLAIGEPDSRRKSGPMLKVHLRGLTNFGRSPWVLAFARMTVWGVTNQSTAAIRNSSL